MRVLMVSDVYTHPYTMGSRQRIYRECCQMKELGWQVDFLYWGGKYGGDIDGMKTFFGKGHFHYVNTTSIEPAYQIKQMIRKKWDKKGLSKYLPIFFNENEWYYKEVEEKIKILLEKEKYDVIWLQYIYQSGILKNIPSNIYTVIDTIDVLTNRNLMYQKKGRVPLGYYMTKRQERKSLSRADLVVAIQNEEENFFKDLMKDKPVQCMTIGDTVKFYGSKTGEKKVFGFIGADYEPNVEAVKWLAKEVLPVVYEMEPESRCVIAGGVCKLIEDNQYYTKIGYVPSLQEYYDQISFSINPIQYGTGLNIKGIEALSYGKPLVSTEIGSKGLADAEGAMAVCKDAKQFVEHVVLLLRDEQRCLIMREKAEKFIYKYNEKNREALLEVEKLAGEKARGGKL